MQNDIIAKIDALVKMSDSSSNAGTMKVELREVECAIKEKKFDLKELKSSISDDKYFDASGEIVDKNIEISLTKKIKTLKKSLEELAEQTSAVVLEEEKLFGELEVLKNVIDEAESFIEVLKIKISSADSEEKNHFKTLLKETESKLKDSKKELDKKQKAYEKVQGKLEVLSFSKNELENKVESETEKLIDIKANLLNKRGYVNAELKKEDQEKIDALSEELEKLEAEKTKILSSPIMIAEEAKNYLIDDDKTSALKKVKELRDLLLELPYMDINSASSKETLAIELENAEAKRDEFASMINSKNYESVDTTLIKDRITYITDRKEKLLKEIEDIKEKISKLDNNELEDLNNRINYCENEVSNLKEKIEEYEITLRDSDLTISKKATLQASFDKKQEELNNIMQLLSSYKNDRRNIVLQSYKYETEEIKEIEEEIKEIDKEIKELEKLSVSSNKVKDIIAMENDKKTLKELNDIVKAIKKRQGLKSTPSEVYDEIEMLLGTEDVFGDIDEPENVEEFETEKVENVVVDNLKEENDSIEQISEMEISDDIPELEIASEENFDIPSISLDEIQLDDEIQFDVVDIEPLEINEETLDVELTDINTEEKLKVVNVEQLDNATESQDEEVIENNEFLIGDYKVEE